MEFRMIRPDQFSVNEAWIAVRINEEFLFVQDINKQYNVRRQIKNFDAVLLWFHNPARWRAGMKVLRKWRSG